MKKYRYLLAFIFTLILITTLLGCKSNNDSNNKVKVMTTIFPIYDFTREIAQDKVEVKLILPPGLEPHSYEPTTQSILEIRNADMFIYTADFFEIWAGKIINVIDQDKVKVINTSKGTTLLHGHEDEEGHEDIDPHIWLDPYNAMIMVDNILEGLIEIDPDNKDFYQNNADNYKLKLIELDETYKDVFTNAKYNTIIFGGHFVFGYLAERYDLKYTSPYHGFSPSSLPTPSKIQDLINLIKSTGQRVIFYEELINPKVAKAISEETGAKMLPLNGAGSISKTDLQNDETYLSIMGKNIENLKEGLGYHG